ncbi:hypothetical protein DPMN_040601 [Dreissena polymorpha]|uniref:Uncharacterized protein n=1 Tax=Dreissena polymorpha TaxID=45954 RepID=A0A9D4CVC6_DREPO|nr:hypothetical protein DPMN_040601 [Dreissena polymorpha]
MNPLGYTFVHSKIDYNENQSKLLLSKWIVADLKAEKSYAVLFPEFEIVTETEIYTPKKDAGQTSEEEKMRQYKEFLESNKGSDLSTSFPEKELQSMASQETVDDKQIRKFKERISAEPDQVNTYLKKILIPLLKSLLQSCSRGTT